MSRSFAFKNGFTLIELMIVIILIAIGAALAAPSFSNIIRDTRLTTQANNLLSSIQLARSEAVRHSVQITILRGDEDWGDGWEVFTDWDGDKKIPDANKNINDCSVEKDCLLGTVSKLSAGNTLSSCDEYVASIAFLPTGQPQSTCDGDPEKNPSFVFCPPTSGIGEVDARLLNISNTGRPSIKKVDSEDVCT